MSMAEVLDVILRGADPEECARVPVPDTYRAAIVRRDDMGMFTGIPPERRDPRASLRYATVATPELAPDEALVAVMASAVNYNTVWSAIFHPVPTFNFLHRLSRGTSWGERHDLPYHVLGSDAAGVVLRVGSLVHSWRPGDEVAVHAAQVDGQDPDGHDDGMLGAGLRAWGYETNFGGLGELCVVRASQLMPKAAHLSWEEAAVNGVCNSTAYRMLVSARGANLRSDDLVLVWGATGGLGLYGVQHVLNSGATPVCVTSSPGKSDLLRQLGCEYVIDRVSGGYHFWRSPTEQNPSEWRRLGRDIRALAGEDPRVVFEHPGRDTMGASVYVARPGGVIVTCAATTGYLVEYDQRQLWMKLKTIRASHIANYAEAWRANDLVRAGKIQPTLSEVYRLEDIGEATGRVHRGQHVGKVGVLCLAPTEGLGIDDPDRRWSMRTDRMSIVRSYARPGAS